jgi:uncharacterized protein YdeI (YjbR/CyaY-like superfamily)
MTGSAVPHNDRERFHAETREQWEAWLADNHAASTGVWLVTWKTGSGRPRLGYEEIVEEALRVGWIDAKARGLDEERAMLWMSPRKPGSGWSRPNKERIARLEKAGLMLPAGKAVLDAAKASGAWTLLDDVENLVVPDDLAAAFDARPGAREHWDGFPRSVKRNSLQWLVYAKRAETRAKRIAQIADRTAAGERPVT